MLSHFKAHHQTLPLPRLLPLSVFFTPPHLALALRHASTTQHPSTHSPTLGFIHHHHTPSRRFLHNAFSQLLYRPICLTAAVESPGRTTFLSGRDAASRARVRARPHLRPRLPLPRPLLLLRTTRSGMILRTVASSGEGLRLDVSQPLPTRPPSIASYLSSRAFLTSPRFSRPRWPEETQEEEPLGRPDRQQGCRLDGTSDCHLRNHDQ